MGIVKKITHKLQSLTDFFFRRTERKRTACKKPFNFLEEMIDNLFILEKSGPLDEIRDN
jgi:hypothetical protein